MDGDTMAGFRTVMAMERTLFNSWGVFDKLNKKENDTRDKSAAATSAADEHFLKFH